MSAAEVCTCGGYPVGNVVEHDGLCALVPDNDPALVAAREDAAREHSDPLCQATARDLGTGRMLRCVLEAHGPDVEHVADGMAWRDGSPPRGFMGGRR